MIWAIGAGRASRRVYASHDPGELCLWGKKSNQCYHFTHYTCTAGGKDLRCFAMGTPGRLEAESLCILQREMQELV